MDGQPSRRSKRSLSKQNQGQRVDSGCTPPKRARISGREDDTDEQIPGPSRATTRSHLSIEKRMKEAEQNAKGQKCAICLTHEMKQPTSLSGCKHIFCCECIKVWISQQGVCPLCKARSEHLLYQYRDAHGVACEKKESVSDLMKQYRDEQSIRSGSNLMLEEAAALNSVIRRIRSEIEAMNRDEDTDLTARLIEERKKLCTSLTGFRRLAGEIGSKPREDIVNDPVFRRLFYDRRLFVTLRPAVTTDSPVSPQLFRTNPELVDRANAFLARDLPILCDSPAEASKARKLILNLLRTYAVDNRDLINSMRDCVTVSSSRHLMRSLGDFLRSGLPLEEYDSRSHHTTSEELASVIIDQEGDDDDIQEMFANINTIFPTSIADVLDGRPSWERGTVYRDGDNRYRPDRDPYGRPTAAGHSRQRDYVTLNESDDEDEDETEDDDEDGVDRSVYTRNCRIPRGAGAQSNPPRPQMSAADAMNLFGDQRGSSNPGLESLTPLLSMLRRYEADRLNQAQTKPEMRTVHTQTVECCRAVPSLRQKVVRRPDDEPSDDEVVETIDLADSDDDIHVLENDDSVIIASPSGPSTSEGSRRPRHVKPYGSSSGRRN